MATDPNISGGDRSSRMFEPMVGSDALFLDPSTTRSSDSSSSNAAAAAPEAASARDPSEGPFNGPGQPGPNVGRRPDNVTGNGGAEQPGSNAGAQTDDGSGGEGS